MALIFSAAGFIICGFSFVFFGLYLKRRTGPERILAEFREEVDKIILEIDAATERDLTLVEDRVKVLKKLLENADRRVADIDRRIAVSAREQERHRAQETAYAALGRQAGLAKITGAGQGASRVIPLSRNAPRRGEDPDGEPVPADGAESAGDPSRSAPSEHAPDEIPPDTPGTAAGASPQTPLFIRAETEITLEAPSFAEQAAKLSREGCPPDVIALRLGATVAEVELALAISGGR
jgi:hypothetical protein